MEHNVSIDKLNLLFRSHLLVKAAAPGLFLLQLMLQHADRFHQPG